MGWYAIKINEIEFELGLPVSFPVLLIIYLTQHIYLYLKIIRFFEEFLIRLIDEFRCNIL